METFPAIVAVLLATLAAVVVSMGAAAVRARQLDKVAVVDVAWGLGFVLIALVAALVGFAADDADGRRWVVLVLVAVWGGRLGWHVRSRALGEHAGQEDPRYAEMLGGSLSEVGLGTAVRRVFAVQGVVQWFVALPVAVGAVLGTAYLPTVVLGVLVWAVGFSFETIGDRQLAAYKARPKDERPPVMDTGLWAWTRHPNYFGDACMWWGLWLTAGLGSGWVVGLATIACPAAMTFFIRNVTGAKLLEKTMSQRPGWDEYAARVPLFFPRPPTVGG
jgi:steroid 5-alpha reductase family enzyme